MGIELIGLLFLVLAGGGGGDLLDMIRLADYWQAQGVAMTPETMLAEVRAGEPGDVAALVKQLGAAEHAQREAAQRKLEAMGPGVLPQLADATKSPDPEVRARAKAVVAKLAGKGRAVAVRRLMSIRALGELKHRPALPVLNELTKSKVLFEADYAARAIAAIEGKPYQRPPVDPKAMASDLWLLPKNCGAVGQAVVTVGKPITADELVRALGDQCPPEQIVKTVLFFAERVGNVRLDGVTMGISDNVGEDTGFLAIIGRGQYDPSAFKAILMGTNPRKKVEIISKTEVLWERDDCCYILPSTDRLVIMVANFTERMPVKHFIEALAAGKGKLADNAEMVKLIRSADPSRPVWGAGVVTEAYKAAPMLAAFKFGIAGGAVKGDKIELAATAVVEQADKVAEALTAFNELIAEARAELIREAARDRDPAVKPLAELFTTLKLAADGAKLTATATVSRDLSGLTRQFFKEARPERLEQRLGAGQQGRRVEPVLEAEEVIAPQ